jgi:hypothetical protein
MVAAASPPKPSSQPPKPPNPTPPPRPEGGKPAAQAAPIGARPADEHDPQAIKFDPPSAPPRWDEKKAEEKPAAAWKPEPALDPLGQKPPAGAYADGMSSADEQRARAAWVEEHGLTAYDEATDQRPDDEKPKFDPHALAGGGAFVAAGAQKQVPGVVPPTKRE